MQLQRRIEVYSAVRTQICRPLEHKHIYMAAEPAAPSSYSAPPTRDDLRSPTPRITDTCLSPRRRYAAAALLLSHGSSARFRRRRAFAWQSLIHLERSPWSKGTLSSGGNPRFPSKPKLRQPRQRQQLSGLRL
ncbi:hypothetical protein AAFF_G00146180 [Aldrovandia affinis]|uniref:Uncharacterized protein n=1 Tax=Aldrovandia affinis TaxID=143900 RepID=A0AAD7RPX1_9TELE|nr:hypothetical protein AAFF_G00146180 [Aldrovandia affinis]